MMQCLGCRKSLVFPLDRSGKVGCKNCGTKMFWSPSRGLHPLRSYEAVDRVEELSTELPCPACGVQLELQDSLSKARNIRCAECKVAFDWSPQNGVSLPNHNREEEIQPQNSVPEFYMPLSDPEPNSVGWLSKFCGGFLRASIIVLAGLVLLWYPIGAKNILVLSMIIWVGAGIATLTLVGKKKWSKLGVSLGLVLLLNPWTLLVIDDEGYDNVSKSFWRMFSPGPDYEALVAEAEALAGEARRELNQGDYQQGLNKLSEATMSASLGKDIKLAEELLEELIRADKKQ